MGRNLATRLASSGVTVNTSGFYYFYFQPRMTYTPEFSHAVSPAMIGGTGMIPSPKPPGTSAPESDLGSEIAATVPVGRLGAPEEVKANGLTAFTFPSAKRL